MKKVYEKPTIETYSLQEKENIMVSAVSFGLVDVSK